MDSNTIVKSTQRQTNNNENTMNYNTISVNHSNFDPPLKGGKSFVEVNHSTKHAALSSQHFDSKFIFKGGPVSGKNKTHDKTLSLNFSRMNKSQYSEVEPKKGIKHSIISESLRSSIEDTRRLDPKVKMSVARSIRLKQEKVTG